jgi:hypothetical protein
MLATLMDLDNFRVLFDAYKLSHCMRGHSYEICLFDHWKLAIPYNKHDEMTHIVVDL